MPSSTSLFETENWSVCGSAVHHRPSMQVVAVLAVTFGGGVVLPLFLGCLAFGNALP